MPAPTRAVALAGLAVAVAGGAASVPLIYAVFFVLGTGETLADTASSAFVPALVAASGLVLGPVRADWLPGPRTPWTYGYLGSATAPGG